ncbi:hypothetical protein [Pilimelia anulata]|uniref:hypothetical protein n=1 Tax=Pilimelia anulata TaxID=53371 RepID=UPI00166565D2|nr:hypothetical protein [Pilimelia anulata]
MESDPERHEETPMTDPVGDADPTADAEAGAEDQPQPFENRAARRSKGKATPNRAGGAASRVHGRSGTVQSPRQYGTRRSG